TYDVALGIKTAVDNGATLINLSLGGSGDSQLLHDVVSQAFAKGIPLVAAAGNVPTTEPTYPAAYPEVLSVTAGNPKTGQLASYANQGSFVDVIAPGTSLVSLNGQYFVVTGTSASTAYVSGYVARLATADGMTPIKAAQSVEASLLSPSKRPK